MNTQERIGKLLIDSEIHEVTGGIYCFCNTATEPRYPFIGELIEFMFGAERRHVTKYFISIQDDLGDTLRSNDVLNSTCFNTCCVKSLKEKGVVQYTLKNHPPQGCP